jgi:hypothetical protein
MYFEFRIRLEPLPKSITPIFPFLSAALCLSLSLLSRRSKNELSKATGPITNTGPELNAAILDCPHRPRLMHFHSRWKNLVNSAIKVAGFGFGFGAWQAWLWM